jgi:phosphoserine phosphatase
MRFVLTLVAGDPAAPLGEYTLRRMREAVVATGARAGAPKWLDPGRACDLPFDSADPGAITDAVRAALAESGLPIDAVAQPAQGRRKALLLADMDSTIVTTETLDELAGEVGLGDRVAAITARSMNGEMDFREALRERVALLTGLPETTLSRTLARTTLTPGARILVRTMVANGAYTALVSGGFRHFTAPIAARAGFDEDVANVLEIRAGALSGCLEEPILDRDGKLATLKRLMSERDLTPADVLAVGDGANDLAMLEAAGLGIAFHARPVVSQAIRDRIDHGDLTALLFLQGYRRRDFVED